MKTLIPILCVLSLAVLCGAELHAQAVTPSFTPAAGTYASTQSVAIGTPTIGANIYYTTDGSTPTTGSTLYSGPISVSSTETIKALAVSTATSLLISPADATIGVGQQIQFFASDNFGNGQSSVTWQTSDNTIAAISTAGLAVGIAQGTVTITGAAPLNSGIATAVYTLESQVATPTINPAAGVYTTSPVSVTMGDSTGGATIYYTLDGSTPTMGSNAYTGAISLTQTKTVKAMAAAAGMVNSAVTSSTFTIGQGQTAAPTFSPVAGTYSTTQSVTLSDATGGSSIYYTTDGSTPTTGSTLYTGAISVSSTQTINAIASAPGLTNSGVASAGYTITGGGGPTINSRSSRSVIVF